jgi:methionyl aminopeptidase
VARAGELITLDVAAELVFTIEPMLTAGAPRIVVEPDGWTIRTADLAPSAHEEHTIMVSEGGPVILTVA